MKWIDREILQARAKAEFWAEKLKRLEAVRALDVPHGTKKPKFKSAVQQPTN